MLVEEKLISFLCEGHRLYGVLHRPEQPFRRGIVQMDRSGPIRQGVLRARRWAESGIPLFRFDPRGRADSEGPHVPIEEWRSDICSAIETFFANLPELQETVVCAGSQSAAAVLMHVLAEPRIVGLAIVNPWLRMEKAVERTRLRMYLAKAIDLDSWVNLWYSESGLTGAARSFAESMVAVARLLDKRGRCAEKQAGSPFTPVLLVKQVARTMKLFPGRFCIILSSGDPAASVFQNELQTEMSELHRAGRATVHELVGADHVLSRGEWQDQMATWIQEWVFSW